ncbi:MAG: CapA family protein [Clostridia bacterium]|nr:CapA family protein [Clostridia bacterium]
MRKQKKTELLLLAFALCFAVAVCFAFVLISRDEPEVPVINDVTTDTVISTVPPDTDAPMEEITEPPTEAVTTEVVSTDVVTTAPPPVENVISFLACGDNLLYRPNTFEADERANYGKRSYGFTYENIAPVIADADIAFINQETLLCGGNTGYPLFNSPFEVAETLKELGFDIANIATNHMLDVGYDYGAYSTGEGIAVSRSTLENNGITVIGGYLDDDDFATVRIIERDGVKIGFIAFTESTNTITLDPASKIVIPYLTEDNVRASVARAKEVADVIIVSAHWGVDSSRNVSDTQRSFAKLFADLGVHAVIGHHSHVVHPIEWIEGKDGNKMLCAYSLGNLIGIMEYPLTILGGILTFDIHTLDGKEPWIDNVGFVPTVYNYNTYYRQNVIYWLEDYTDEMAEKHGVYTIYNNKFTVAELKDYLNTVVPSNVLRSKNDYLGN